MLRNFELLPFVNHMRQNRMFCRRFYGRPLVFQDLCANPDYIEEFWRKCEILVFNESTGNSTIESIARIVFCAFCWDKSRKRNDMF